MSPDNLVFVGFNSYVLALDRDTGAIAWQWRSPKPRSGGYVTLLLDDDRLIVAVNGYIYCLDPQTGDEFWRNETKGFGFGVTSIATIRGYAPFEIQEQAAAADAQQRGGSASSLTNPSCHQPGAW